MAHTLAALGVGGGEEEEEEEGAVLWCAATSSSCHCCLKHSRPGKAQAEIRETASIKDIQHDPRRTSRALYTM